MSQLFERKPIAALISETEGSSGLKRTLRAGDLIMLAIGAVIGAGIFGAIGTAAAGQLGPHGEVIRAAAGPALVFSFLLLRSEEHTSELQSLRHLVCRLLL